MIDNRKPIKVYCWNKKTKVFSEERKAAPDPNAPDNYLVPGNATTVEPPKKRNGYTNCWNGKKWEAKKD